MSKAPKGQNYFMFGCATTKKRIRKIVNDRLEDLKIEQQKHSKYYSTAKSIELKSRIDELTVLLNTI